MQMSFSIRQFTKNTELFFSDSISWLIIHGNGSLNIDEMSYNITLNDFIQLPVEKPFILEIKTAITIGIVTLSDVITTRKDYKMIPAKETGLIRQVFWMALTVEQSESPNKSKIMSTLWQLMWEAYVDAGIKSRPGNIIVRDVLRQINDHYLDSNFNLNQIIITTGYSPGHFRKMFKEETGLSPLEHLNLRRLEHAKKIMWQEAEKAIIKDVAERSGFAEANNFTKFFKRTMGITPKQYVNQILKEKE